MNGKDADLLALCLKSTKPADILSNRTARLQWFADVAAVGELLKRDLGPSFDSRQFYTDCGVPS